MYRVQFLPPGCAAYPSRCNHKAYIPASRTMEGRTWLCSGVFPEHRSPHRITSRSNHAASMVVLQRRDGRTWCVSGVIPAYRSPHPVTSRCNHAASMVEIRTREGRTRFGCGGGRFTQLHGTRSIMPWEADGISKEG